MSIIQNLAKIKEVKDICRAKETSCDIYLTISDSVSIPGPSIIHESQESFHTETNLLCMLDYEAPKEASTKSKNRKRGSYQKYSAEERLNIGKHSVEYGTASTLKKFRSMHPELKERTVRGLCLYTRKNYVMP